MSKLYEKELWKECTQMVINLRVLNKDWLTGSVEEEKIIWPQAIELELWQLGIFKAK